jgi:hypothetical protein
MRFAIPVVLVPVPVPQVAVVEICRTGTASLENLISFVRHTTDKYIYLARA